MTLKSFSRIKLTAFRIFADLPELDVLTGVSMLDFYVDTAA